ncbi:MAG: hypothetical protein R3B69_00410 [Candidatus Paceibacterota bacterium]
MVNAGNNDFYNVVFNNAGGGWTLTSATSTQNFTLTAASSFTLNTGEVLSVEGVFMNAVGVQTLPGAGRRLNYSPVQIIQ